uniref:Uncharacterized protein n=1 Tax=Serratia marcescens TaxID=615 RepID=A0A1C3HNB3_SERMA|nr:Uncharacterised protein [Serratia marcescens]
MEVIIKFTLTLFSFMLIFFCVRRLSNYISNKRSIRECEDMITLINIQLNDETLDKESKNDMQTTKTVCQHEINVRKGKVLLKSGWRPN